eukprot:scaffold121760_cov33-Phaeocystis_antarctica.AAC.1
MNYMFNVRSSPCPAPNLQSRPPLHAACAVVPRRLPVSRPPPYALLSTRQSANSLSNANKLLIRCAWAGTSDHTGVKFDAGVGGLPDPE